eukprot:s212_g4.t1
METGWCNPSSEVPARCADNSLAKVRLGFPAFFTPATPLTELREAEEAPGRPTIPSITEPELISIESSAESEELFCAAMTRHWLSPDLGVARGLHGLVPSATLETEVSDPQGPVSELARFAVWGRDPVLL